MNDSVNLFSQISVLRQETLSKFLTKKTNYYISCESTIEPCLLSKRKHVLLCYTERV